LNGFDVQLIDLRGYGLSGGYRMVNNRVHDYHYDVTALLKQCDPKLPLFLYAHSMGGLTVTTYLLNNPNLKVSGVILSAPLLYFHESKQADEAKKAAVKALAPHLEVSYNRFNHKIGILGKSRSTHSCNRER
jgi:acylglycerol lipase